MGAQGGRIEDVGVAGSDLSEFVERVTAAQAESMRLMARAQRLSAHSVALALRADETAPAAVRRAVTEFAGSAGASGEALEGIRVAVSEAVNNAVVHAYDPAEGGIVYVDAYLLGRGTLTVLVADDGRGPRGPSPTPGMGLGWKLIARFAEKWTVTHRGSGGTMIYMRFRLSDSGFVGRS